MWLTRNKYKLCFVQLLRSATLCSVTLFALFIIFCRWFFSFYFIVNIWQKRNRMRWIVYGKRWEEEWNREKYRERESDVVCIAESNNLVTRSKEILQKSTQFHLSQIHFQHVRHSSKSKWKKKSCRIYAASIVTYQIRCVFSYVDWLVYQ